MNQKVLGTIAIVCSPFLCVDLLIHGHSEGDWTTGLLEFIYMTGWMCSVVWMWKIEATGPGKWQKSLLVIELVFLSLAQIFNIDVLFDGPDNSALQRYLDIFWPISNGFMLFVGIAAASARKLQGWKKWVPLAVGLWLPLLFILMAITGNRALLIAGPYSAVAWSLLGLSVYGCTAAASKETLIASNGPIRITP